MAHARRSIAVIACAVLVNCSGSSENPLVEGLSADQQTQLIEQSINQIESAENFTPEDFEQRQQEHFESITEEMHDAALEYLRKRSDKIMLLEMSQTVELDRESAEIELRMDGPETALALFTVDGNRSYRTNHATKTIETRFTLPWLITTSRGKLVFHHQGVRMKDLKN
jgi:hypothetical protein